MKKMMHGNIEHGLIETIANSILDHGYANLSEANKKDVLAQKKKDLELVDVIYQNLDNSETGKFEGAYGTYSGEPIRFYRFIAGQRYSIPRGFARQINEELGCPVRSGLLDSNGKELAKDGQTKRTHQMIPASQF